MSMINLSATTGLRRACKIGFLFKGLDVNRDIVSAKLQRKFCGLFKYIYVGFLFFEQVKASVKKKLKNFSSLLYYGDCLYVN